MISDENIEKANQLKEFLRNAHEARTKSVLAQVFNGMSPVPAIPERAGNLPLMVTAYALLVNELLLELSQFAQARMVAGEHLPEGTDMTQDDVLAYMASFPPSKRPTELRSAKAMLAVWCGLRNDMDFANDVIDRHGLASCGVIDMSNPIHEHAIGNAWGHAVQFLLESKETK